MFSMDIWPLKYFLAAARAGNLTRAAQTLHLSQPALSMRLAELERELGHPLFVRGARGMTLTEKGALLMRRAEDLVELAERIESEIRADDVKGLSGTIAIGAGETVAFTPVANAIKSLCAENPNLHIDITSGNGEDIQARIQSGTIDLGLFVGPGRYKGYDHIAMPHVLRWGLIMRRDAPLASRQSIRAKDLDGIPILLTRQMMVGEFLSGWLGHACGALNIVCTYNLAYNADLLVAAGLGSAICIDNVIPAAFADSIVFRPFSPTLSSDAYLAWRKDVPLSPAANALVERVRATVA